MTRDSLAAEIRAWRRRRDLCRRYWSPRDHLDVSADAYADCLADVERLLGTLARPLDVADACTLAARALRAYATACPKAVRA